MDFLLLQGALSEIRFEISGTPKAADYPVIFTLLTNVESIRQAQRPPEFRWDICALW